MTCPYRENGFCSLLSEEDRAALCRHCHIRRYAKGQWLARKMWGDSLVLCVEGLMVFGNMDEKRGRLVTNEIMGRGVFPSTGNCSGGVLHAVSDRNILCMTDCVVAEFEPDYIARMFESNIAFVKVVFRICMQACCNDSIELLNAIGNGDAYAAVRYVCQTCKKYGVPVLTHEQIALICNRSRPTVTETMHLLIKKEPELFLR